MNNRELKVEVCGRVYAVAYPNVGQMIDISVRENSLANGKLRDLILNGTGDQQDAYLMIKSVAFFEIMLPNMVKDLKTESLMKLAPEDFMVINKVYWESVDKWLAEWKQSFSNPIMEVPEEQIN
jgi:hypothetical protein